jgi:hypothetical protein
MWERREQRTGDHRGCREALVGSFGRAAKDLLF